MLLGNTFTERCPVVHHALTDEDMSKANLKRSQRASMKIEQFKPNVKKKMSGSQRRMMSSSTVYEEVEDSRRLLKFQPALRHDKSVAVAHAILGGHRRITAAEYRYLDMLQPYLRNPLESVKLRILELAYQGNSIQENCRILNKDYETYRRFMCQTAEKLIMSRSGRINISWTWHIVCVCLFNDLPSRVDAFWQRVGPMEPK